LPAPIETKTANFTAVVGGRYIVESGGTVSITDPSGTAAGDSYEVWIGSGSIQFNGTGTSYTASRFSIRRRYSGSAWTTPSPMLSDTADGRQRNMEWQRVYRSAVFRGTGGTHRAIRH
jgi:hypothetical protein